MTTIAAAAPRLTAAARASKRGIEARGKLPILILFLPPALLLFTIFVMLPMGEAAWYSFYNWNGYSLPTEWVGLPQLRADLPERRLPHGADQQRPDHPDLDLSSRCRWRSGSRPW